MEIERQREKETDIQTEGGGDKYTIRIRYILPTQCDSTARPIVMATRRHHSPIVLTDRNVT